MDPNAIQHRTHSSDEPLPSKARFDYSPQKMEKAKLPRSEEGNAQEEQRSSKACSPEHAKEHHQCHSELHFKEPLAHNAPPTAEGHHFFTEENPRPKPVDSSGEFRPIS